MKGQWDKWTGGNCTEYVERAERWRCGSGEKAYARKQVVGRERGVWCVERISSVQNAMTVTRVLTCREKIGSWITCEIVPWVVNDNYSEVVSVGKKFVNACRLFSIAGAFGRTTELP